MAKEEKVKTVEEVIAEFEAQLVEKDKVIAIKDKALEEATNAILELTEQLNQKKELQASNDTITIQGKKYPLLLKEVNHKGKLIKYEDFVADEMLAKEVLDMDAGVFGAGL